MAKYICEARLKKVEGLKCAGSKCAHGIPHEFVDNGSAGDFIENCFPPGYRHCTCVPLDLERLMKEVIKKEKGDEDGKNICNG